jgi:hypothetical protein
MEELDKGRRFGSSGFNLAFEGLLLEGEPLYHRGGYPQRPPQLRFSISQHFGLCKRDARRVLQGAEGVRGLHVEARTDWRQGGVHHRPSGGQSAKAACCPLARGSRARVTHGGM